MHTGDLWEDRHKHDKPKQVDVDLLCADWRRRIRAGEDGGDRKRDDDVDADGLSGEEPFRLVNAEVVRRIGEFIVSLFLSPLSILWLPTSKRALTAPKDRTRSVM
jgi:hypothetical protein